MPNRHGCSTRIAALSLSSIVFHRISALPSGTPGAVYHSTIAASASDSPCAKVLFALKSRMFVVPRFFWPLSNPPGAAVVEISLLLHFFRLVNNLSLSFHNRTPESFLRLQCDVWIYTLNQTGGYEFINIIDPELTTRVMISVNFFKLPKSTIFSNNVWMWNKPIMYEPLSFIPPKGFT